MVQAVRIELTPDNLPCVKNTADNSVVKIFKDRMLCAFTSIKTAFCHLYHFLFNEWPTEKKIQMDFCNGFYKYKNLEISEKVLFYMKNRCLENRRYKINESSFSGNLA